MDILMPQLGETVTEGAIISWQRAVGDRVAPGDVLFEIETDKTTMEVPATSAGSISEIRVPAGQVVPVGAVVAIIVGDGEVVAEAAPANGTVLLVAAPPAPAPLASAPPPSATNTASSSTPSATSSSAIVAAPSHVPMSRLSSTR